MVLFGNTHTIKRRVTEGYYNNSGVFVPGALDDDLTVIADCQALTSKELESLNIGRDNLGKIKIFCDTELIIAVPGTDGTELQNA